MKRKYSTAFKKSIYKKRNVKRKLVFRPKRRVRRSRGLPLTGFPNRTIARMRYGHQFTLDATAIAPAKQVYSCNSCYDPDLTGTGHQPRGFDQMMAVYNHCTVIGAKITARFMNPGNTNLVPSNVGIAISAGAEFVSTSTLQDVLENKYVTRPRLAGPMGLTNGGANSVVLTKKFSSKRFFGKKTIVGDALYRHNDSSNPTEQAFFEVFAYPNVSGYNPEALLVEVQIDYICVFTEPKILPAS